MGSRRTVSVIAVGVTALALATAGCSGSKSKAPALGANATGGAGGGDAPATSPQGVAAAFLAAWASGDYAKAASMTDDSAKAAPRLESVMKSLGPKTVELTLGSQDTAPLNTNSTPTPNASASSAAAPVSGATSAAAPATTATRYNFNVVDTFDNGLQWKYSSLLSVVSGSGTTPPLVHWSSAVINPQLGAPATLKVENAPVPVADSKGVVLTAANHPDIAGLLSKLALVTPAGSPPPTGMTIQFVDVNTGATISGSTPITVGTPSSTAGLQLTTTLDDKVQTAAEQAVAANPNSGMVVIKPSTGEILAMATNSATVASLAYRATRAPGSTFKTVAAAALLQAGMKISDPADCTPTATVGSQTYHNDEGLKDGFTGATLLTAYEKSCNTSFVNSNKLLPSLSALSDEAMTYFGMNQPWDLGLGQATYCTAGNQQVPPADGRDLFAAEMFGQGKITMCPLTMASVAATVATGSFKQPILIPTQKPITKTTDLPADVDQNLQTLMKGVVTDGTATSLQGISPTLGAKTGSAEPNAKDKTDSWMIAQDPQHDIAVAALVLNGGFGNAAAGPEIKAMLHKIGIG